MGQQGLGNISPQLIAKSLRGGGFLGVYGHGFIVLIDRTVAVVVDAVQAAEAGGLVGDAGLTIGALIEAIRAETGGKGFGDAAARAGEIAALREKAHKARMPKAVLEEVEIMRDTTSRATPIALGMVGGGQGAFIGAVHRIAARLDDEYAFVAGALSSDPDRALASAAELGLDPGRTYADFATMAVAEAARYGIDLNEGLDSGTISTAAKQALAPHQSLVNAANLADRYIADRFLPDKAIDLIDEAAAQLRLEIDSVPAEVDEVQRRILQLEVERQRVKSVLSAARASKFGEVGRE